MAATPDDTNWLGGNGDWSNPALWSNGVPQGSSVAATIATGNPATITIGSGESFSAGAVTLDGYDATLDVLGTLAAGSFALDLGTLIDAGVISGAIAVTYGGTLIEAAGTQQTLPAPADVTLAGGALEYQSTLAAPVTITNDAGATFDGFGLIGDVYNYNSVTGTDVPVSTTVLDNQGTIGVTRGTTYASYGTGTDYANHLALNVDTLDNTGLITATAGVVDFGGVSLTNNGDIIGNSAAIILYGDVVNSGLISMTNGTLLLGTLTTTGTVIATSAQVTLAGPENLSAIRALTLSDDQITLDGGFANAGQTLDATSTPLAGATLGGAGTISLGALNEAALGMQFAGGTLDGVALIDGFTLGSGNLTLAGTSAAFTDAGATPGTITLDGGTLAIDASSSGTITQPVLVQSGTLMLEPASPGTSFAIDAPITVSGSASALEIDPAFQGQAASWTNQGSIDVGNGATLVLGGVATAADFGALSAAAATVELTGTFDNGGSSLDAASGLLVGATLATGGEIVGGTVDAAASGLEFDGGMLDNVALINGFTLGTGNATFLGTTALETGATASGTATIDGGALVIDAPAGDTISQAVLVSAGGVTLQAVGGASLSIAGALSAAGADSTIAIQPSNDGTVATTFTDTSTISLAGGATLQLGGAFTAADLGAFTNDGGTVVVSGTLDNAGQTLNGAETALKGLDLLGGTIVGGAVDVAALGLGTGNGTGTLADVTLLNNLSLANGNLVLAGSDPILNGTSGTGSITIGGGASVTLAGNPTISLANPIDLLGGSLDFQGSSIGAPVLVTLAAGEQIAGSGEIGGPYGLDTVLNDGTIAARGSAYSALEIVPAALINAGLISAASLTSLYLGSNGVRAGSLVNEGTILGTDAVGVTLAGDFTNSGLVSVSGGLLVLGGGAATSWTNSGTILATSAAVQLNGDTSLVNLAGVTLSGSSLTLDGTLDATGATLNGSGIGSLLAGATLQGGTILGGIVDFGRIGLAATDGVFNGSTFINGLTLTSQNVTLEGTDPVFADNGTTAGTIVIDGTQYPTPALTLIAGPGDVLTQPIEVIDGTGALVGAFSLAANITAAGTGAVLALQGSAAYGAAGSNATSWVNLATITAGAGAQILLGGDETAADIGTIADSGASLFFTSGTFDNIGQTLGAEDPSLIGLDLAGGTFDGGVIDVAAASFTVARPTYRIGVTPGAVLENVTLIGGLTVDNVGVSLIGSTAIWTDQAETSAGSLLIEQGGTADLASGGTATLANPVTLEGGSLGWIPAAGLEAGSVAATIDVVLAASETIIGTGFLAFNGAPTSLTNDGTIIGAAEPGYVSALTIGAAGFTNTGLITAAAGGTVVIAPGTYDQPGTASNTGTILAGPSASVTLGGNFTNDGVILGTGGTVQLGARTGATYTNGIRYDLYGGFTNLGTVSASGGLILLNGDLSAAGLGSLAVTGGTIVLSGGTFDNNAGTLGALSTDLLGIVLDGGTIAGGELDPAALGLRVQPIAGRYGTSAIQGVTVLGDLSINGALLLDGTTRLEDTAGTAAGTVTVGSGGTLILSGPATATLTNDVLLQSGSPNNASLDWTGSTPAPTLDIASGVTVSGAGTLGTYAGTLINQGGTIDANAGYIDITSPSLINQGLIEATGGDIQLSVTTLATGSVAVIGVTQASALYDYSLAEFDAALLVQGSSASASLNDLTLIGTGGRITVADQGVLVDQNDLTLDGSLILNGGTANLFSLAVGPAGLVTGTGTANFTSLGNDGTVVAAGGLLDLTGSVSGTGLSVAAFSTLELAATDRADVSLLAGGATLQLDAPGSFSGTISGFTTGDALVVGGFAADAAQFANNVLTISNGTASLLLALDGPFATDAFGVFINSAGQSVVTLNTGSDPVGIATPANVFDNPGTVVGVPGLAVSDSLDNTITVQVTDQYGVLDANPVPNVQVQGGGTGTLIVIGDIAGVNDALATLEYRAPDPGQPGDAITISASAASGIASALIPVDINQPPIFALPVAALLTSGSASALTGVTLAKSDAISGEIFTVTASDQFDVITGAASFGSTLTGSGSALVTLTGTLGAINADLAGLSFTGSQNDLLTLSASDGLGGSVVADLPLDVNVPPVINGPSTFIATLAMPRGDLGISISDLYGSAINETLTVTLAAQSGRLAAGGTGATITGNNTSTLSLSGTVTDINTALAALSYTATEQGGSIDPIAITAVDAFGATTSVTIDAVDLGQPPLFVTPADELLQAGTFAPLAGIALDKTQPLPGEQFTVVLGDSHDILEGSATGGGTLLGSGTNLVTLTGTLGAVNAELAGLSIVGTVNDTLSLLALDGSAGTAQASLPLDVNIPATIEAQGSIVFIGGTAVGIPGLAIQDPYVAAAGQTLAVTIADRIGTIDVGSVSGVGISGNGSGTISLSGSVPAINSALSTISYLAPSGDTSIDLVSVTAVDQSGGTAQVVIDAVPPAPPTLQLPSIVAVSPDIESAIDGMVVSPGGNESPGTSISLTVSASFGTLGVQLLPAGVSIVGNNSNEIELVGQADAIDVALSSLIYQGGADGSSTLINDVPVVDTLQVSAIEDGATATGAIPLTSPTVPAGTIGPLVAQPVLVLATDETPLSAAFLQWDQNNLGYVGTLYVDLPPHLTGQPGASAIALALTGFDSTIPVPLVAGYVGVGPSLMSSSATLEPFAPLNGNWVSSYGEAPAVALTSLGEGSSLQFSISSTDIGAGLNDRLTYVISSHSGSVLLPDRRLTVVFNKPGGYSVSSPASSSGSQPTPDGGGGNIGGGSGNTATVGGDVHLATFDKLHYDFQAVGEFVLAKSTAPGDSFQVQARLQPWFNSASVSVMTEIAAAVGTDRITFALNRAAAVWVDGAAVTLTDGQPYHLDGGVLEQLSATSWEVIWDTGEKMTVTNEGTFLDVSTTLPRHAAPGSVEGLLGTDTGNPASDFTLPNGTILQQPLSFAQLYTSFADAWRVTQSGSLFDYGPGQSTASFTDLSFPSDTVDLANIPATLYQNALSLVTAAGITNPAAQQSAVEDYLLTGNTQFITAAAQQTVSTAVFLPSPSAPATASVLGIGAAQTDAVLAAPNSAAVTFTVYTTEPAASAEIVDYTVISPGTGYLSAGNFTGDTLPSGSVTIAAGATSASLVLDVIGSLGLVADQTLAVSLSPVGGDTIAVPTAYVDVLNATPVQGNSGAPAFADLSPLGTVSGTGTNETLSLGTIVQGANLKDIVIDLANAATTPADTLSGLLGATGSGQIDFLSALTDLVDLTPGDVQPLSFSVDTATLGSIGKVLTFTANESNASGYGALLGTYELTITADIAPGPVITTPAEALEPYGGTGPLTGIAVSVADTAALGDILTVSLGDTSGLLSVGTAGAATVTGDGTSQLTLTGTLGAIDKALASLVFSGTANDTLAISAGFAGGATDHQTLAILAAAPTILAGNFAGADGSPTTIAAPTLVDGYAAAQGELVTLTIADSFGTLAAAGTGITGNGSKTLNLTGTVSKINQDLAGLTYIGPAGGFTSDPLVFSVTDPSGETAHTTIDAQGPTLQISAPAGLATPFGTAVGLGNLSLSDPNEATNGSTVTVTLTGGSGDFALGTVAPGLGASVSGAGTGTFVIAGSLAAVNADLAATTYTETISSGTITIAASDVTGATATADIATTDQGIGQLDGIISSLGAQGPAALGTLQQPLLTTLFSLLGNPITVQQLTTNAAAAGSPFSGSDYATSVVDATDAMQTASDSGTSGSTINNTGLVQVDQALNDAFNSFGDTNSASQDNLQNINSAISVLNGYFSDQTNSGSGAVPSSVSSSINSIVTALADTAQQAGGAPASISSVGNDIGATLSNIVGAYANAIPGNPAQSGAVGLTLMIGAVAAETLNMLATFAGETAPGQFFSGQNFIAPFNVVGQVVSSAASLYNDLNTPNNTGAILQDLTNLTGAVAVAGLTFAGEAAAATTVGEYLFIEQFSTAIGNFIGSTLSSIAAQALDKNIPNIVSALKSLQGAISSLHSSSLAQALLTLFQQFLPFGGWGDVHLTTFSGQLYNFQAAGEFTLAQSTIAGNSFDIQARLQPWYNGASVSVMTQLAMSVGTDRVTFGLDRGSLVWVDGTASTIDAASPIVQLNGGTLIELSPDQYAVQWNTGELALITNNGSYLSIQIGLSRTDGANTVQGLLGPNNGPANDFELPNGTVLTQPFSQSTLYTTFANAWRITQAQSLFDYAAGQSTTTFTDLNFPGSTVNLASLPPSLIAQAQSLVAAAGITNPAAAQAAELDYLATGNASFIDNGIGTTGSVTAANLTATSTDPLLAASGTASTSGAFEAGIFAPVTTAVEPSGASPGSTALAVDFEVYLTGTASTATVLDYSVIAPDSGDIGAVAFGGTLPSGTIMIAAGQTTADITLDLPADLLGASASAPLEVLIGSPGSITPIFAPTAEITITNSVPAAGPAAIPSLAVAGGPGSLLVNGGQDVVDLGPVFLGQSLSAVTLDLGNGAAFGADLLGGEFGGATGSGFGLIPAGVTPIAPGGNDPVLAATIDTATLGSFSESVLLFPTDQNPTGYDATLSPIDIVFTDSIINMATASLDQPTSIDLGDVHVGANAGTLLTISNIAANPGGGLDVSIAGVSGAAIGSGVITTLAPGATDNSHVILGIDTATSGPAGGVVTLALASDGSAPGVIGQTVALPADTIDLTATVLNYATAAIVEVSGGGTITTVGTGETLDLGTLPLNGSAVIELAVANSAAGPADLLEGSFAIGDSASFINTGFTSFSGLAAGTSLGGDSVTLAASGPGSFAETITLAATGYDASGFSGSLPIETLLIEGDMACFAAGTRILTLHGEVPVERLRKGDRVITRNGASREIVWHGHRRINCRRHPRPEAVWPVVIAPNAFGPGLPARPLRLSPDHGVLIEGVLVPAKYLVNGATIVQHPVAGITYHHIETEQHDIVWAEQLPTETYLDCGNRHNFGTGPLMSLHPEFAPPVWDAARACAPLVLEGPLLVAIRRSLHDGALAQGYRIEQGLAVTLECRGKPLAARAIGPDRISFDISRCAADPILRSPAASPAACDPASDDRRTLGVALRGLWLDGQPVDLANPLLGHGFHPPEQDGLLRWRWTDGAAVLPHALFPAKGCSLTVEIGGVCARWSGPAEPQPIDAIVRSTARA